MRLTDHNSIIERFPSIIERFPYCWFNERMAKQRSFSLLV
jgi:hypothetical protein